MFFLQFVKNGRCHDDLKKRMIQTVVWDKMLKNKYATFP